MVPRDAQRRGQFSKFRMKGAHRGEIRTGPGKTEQGLDSEGNTRSARIGYLGLTASLMV